MMHISTQTGDRGMFGYVTVPVQNDYLKHFWWHICIHNLFYSLLIEFQINVLYTSFYLAIGSIYNI